MTRPDVEQSTYAGLGLRALAALIDNAVWLLFVAWYVPQQLFEQSAELAWISAVVIASAWFNYFWFAEWRWGQTIGKNALGLRVVEESGDPVPWNAAAMRNLFRLVDLLAVGPLLIALSRRRQRLGDRVAHTLVLREARAPTFAPLAAPAVAPAPPPPPTARRNRPAGVAPGQWMPIHVLWGVLAAIGVLIVAGAILGIVFAVAGVRADGAAATLSSQALLAATLIGVAAYFPVTRAGSWRGAVAALGLRSFRPSGIWLALGAFLAYFLFSALVVVPVFEPDQRDITRDLGFEESTIAAIASGVLIVGAAPLAEEVFFRGFMFAGLRRRLPLWPAAVMSAALFGAVHLTAGDIGVAVQLTAFGVALAWLYERTGSLWPAIMLHLLNNAIAFTVVVTT